MLFNITAYETVTFFIEVDASLCVYFAPVLCPVIITAYLYFCIVSEKDSFILLKLMLDELYHFLKYASRTLRQLTSRISSSSLVYYVSILKCVCIVFACRIKKDLNSDQDCLYRCDFVLVLIVGSLFDILGRS